MEWLMNIANEVNDQRDSHRLTWDELVPRMIMDHCHAPIKCCHDISILHRKFGWVCQEIWVFWIAAQIDKMPVLKVSAKHSPVHMLHLIRPGGHIDGVERIGIEL